MEISTVFHRLLKVVLRHPNDKQFAAVVDVQGDRERLVNPENQAHGCHFVFCYKSQKMI